MMKKALSLSILGLLVLAGCTSGSEDSPSGPAPAAPKSASDLPANMSDADRKAATSALGAASAQQQMANDPARVRAMEEMKKQHGGG